MGDNDMLMIRGPACTRAVTVLLRGANDYLLDEMDRSLHDAFCIVKRVLENERVVPGACTARSVCVCVCGGAPAGPISAAETRSPPAPTHPPARRRRRGGDGAVCLPGAVRHHAGQP